MPLNAQLLLWSSTFLFKHLIFVSEYKRHAIYQSEFNNFPKHIDNKGLFLKPSTTTEIAVKIQMYLSHLLISY